MDMDNELNIDDIEHQSASPKTPEDAMMIKLRSLEQDVKEIHRKLAHVMTHNSGTDNECLKKENEILQREVDQLRVKVAELQSKEKYYMEKLEAITRELKLEESSIESSGNEESIFDPILTVQTLERFMESLKTKNKDLEEKIRLRDDAIQNLQNKIAEKNSHENMIKDLCDSEFETPRELERLRAINSDPRNRLSSEEVEKQLAKVNALMNAGDIDSADSISSTLLCTNSRDDKVIINYNKVSEIKRCVNTIDYELLKFDNTVRNIEFSFNVVKSIADYPALVEEVERKMLRFYCQRRYTKKALNLCTSYLSKNDCRDASIYYMYGDLLLTKPDFRAAREAYGLSLKYSNEGDSDLDLLYEKASETLNAELCRNPWTLFNPSGDTLALPALRAKYEELTEYFRPNKQLRYVKQYQDFARLMTHHLTKVYNTLGIV